MSVTVFIAVLAALSFFFAIGMARRTMALLLWFGWACLFNRNNFIANPGIPFVGWLLLASALVPMGEPWRAGRASGDKWDMPPVIYWGAWLIMAIGYTVSGIDKASAPSWQDGTAIRHLLNNPLARDWFLRDLLNSLPDFLIHVQTWAVLFLEASFAVLAFFARTRFYIWLAVVVMHLGILMVVDFADLTFGVLMIHLFTFDARWFPPGKGHLVIFFDGVCGLCNRVVDLLLKIDEESRLRFTPLQGETAAKDLPKNLSQDFATIVIKRGDGLFERSTAILHILGHLGGMWAIAKVFFLVPRIVRDACYDAVAANRYKIFGKKDTCRLPTPAERARFLP